MGRIAPFVGLTLDRLGCGIIDTYITYSVGSAPAMNSFPTVHQMPPAILDAAVELIHRVCDNSNIGKPRMSDCSELYDGCSGKIMHELGLRFIHRTNPSKWVQVSVFTNRYLIMFDSVDEASQSVCVQGDINTADVIEEVATRVRDHV